MTRRGCPAKNLQIFCIFRLTNCFCRRILTKNKPLTGSEYPSEHRAKRAAGGEIAATEPMANGPGRASRKPLGK